MADGGVILVERVDELILSSRLILFRSQAILACCLLCFARFKFLKIARSEEIVQTITCTPIMTIPLLFPRARLSWC